MPADFPIKFSITVPGQEPFVFALQRFSETIADFTPFWSEYFAPTWFSYVAAVYASGGAESGAAWDALTARYAAWKEKHWPGQPIGVRTGATRSSLTMPEDEHAVLTISRDAFAVGTNLPYPIYLQLGTGRMPARPPLRLTDQFVSQDVARLLQKF